MDEEEEGGKKRGGTGRHRRRRKGPAPGTRRSAHSDMPRVASDKHGYSGAVWLA
ncbi:hypothetical protein ACS15_4089 [Ralstonia insidiosa]|uniref:Uncharacterized protein n=1 Tax=Ralstonia insidiosa TaxID=190721 RepID=A0AAC9BL57_9RALS|nr:hypothetical protein ACS15_4089 [Ralstonia insidiosa]